MDFREAAERRDEALAIDGGFSRALLEILDEWRVIELGDAIGGSGPRLGGEADPRHSHQRQKASPVADLRELDDAAGAAERIEFRRRIGLLIAARRLDDADQAFAAQRVIEHRKIARLEYRQLNRPAQH